MHALRESGGLGSWVLRTRTVCACYVPGTVVLCNVHDVAPVRGSLGGRQGSERLDAFPIITELGSGSTSWLQRPGSLSCMSHTVQIHEAQKGL